MTQPDSLSPVISPAHAAHLARLAAKPVSQNTAAVRAALAGQREVRGYGIADTSPWGVLAEREAVMLLLADIAAWCDEHNQDFDFMALTAQEVSANS